MRRRSFPVTLALVVLIVLATANLGLAAQTDPATPDATPVTPNAEVGPNSPMFRGNPAHTGQMPGPGPEGDPGVLWRVETGGGPQSPAVVDGVVYVGGFGNYLNALDAATGEVRWRYEYLAGHSSPAVVEGTVYVGALDGVHAVDAATGEGRWIFETGQTPPDVHSSPVVADGTVYVGGFVGGGLYAIDAETGEQRWRFDLRSNVYSSPAVVDGVVYVGSDGENYDNADVAADPTALYAVDSATGEERWRFESGTPGDQLHASPAVAGDTVYIGSVNGPNGFLHAVDVATGEERWRFDGAGGVFPSAAVDGDTVYVAGESGNLIALDAATGTERWRFATGAPVGAAPSVADGVVYVQSWDGFLYAVDAADGSERWRIETQGGQSSPVIVDGVVYLSSSDGFVYAIGSAADASPVASPETAPVASPVAAASEVLIEATFPAEAYPTLPAIGIIDYATWPAGTGYRYAENVKAIGINCVLAGVWAFRADEAVSVSRGGVPAEVPAGEEAVLAAGDCAALRGDLHRDERNAGAGELILLSALILPDGSPPPANLPESIVVQWAGAFIPPPVWEAIPRGRVTLTLRAVTVGAGEVVPAYAGPGAQMIGAAPLATTHVSVRPDGSRRNIGDAPLVTYELTALPAAGVAAGATPDASPAASPVATGPSPVEHVWSSTGGPDPLVAPADVVVAPDGNLWIVDSGNSRFQIFTPEGEFVEVWGRQGDGDGEFNFVRDPNDPNSGIGGVAFAPDGGFYVVDTGNQRVQQFAADRSFVRAWGSFGPGDGQFVDPIAIAVDADGNVFVIDDQRDDVQKFTADGEFVLKFGGHGTEPGQLNFTGFLSLDAEGNVWVADWENHRVQQFANDGAYLQTWGERGSGPGQFDRPNDVAVTEDGIVYVADFGNNRIQVFAADGQFLAEWGGAGTADGQFNGPAGIAVDAGGNVYVADAFNHRVQGFRLLTPLTPGGTPAA